MSFADSFTGYQRVGSSGRHRFRTDTEDGPASGAVPETPEAGPADGSPAADPVD